MAQKEIREADGKRMMSRLLSGYTGEGCSIGNRLVSVNAGTDLDVLPEKHRWLTQERLVVKPDELIKRRGKNSLLLLNAGWDQVREWIMERRGKRITINNTEGIVEHFIVEPFVPHEDEYYLAIISTREGDEVLFHHQGGINVGDIDETALRLKIPVGERPDAAGIEKELLVHVPKGRRGLLSCFIRGLFNFYLDLNYAYLEINPLVVSAQGELYVLDLAARLDDTAQHVSGKKWGNISFPPPFGRTLSQEEAFVEKLDSQTGASLKLTVLNPHGRIWTMIAGGGASVIYADTITDLGYMDELANYGEYSGDPNENTTYLYAKTILDLMTRERHKKGKILIMGGGISNFTDVVSTFKGVIRAIREYREKLRDHKVTVFVRRGGLNYKEGLKIMNELGQETGIPIHVYGPETHMTKIVPMAIKVLEGGGEGHHVQQ